MIKIKRNIKQNLDNNLKIIKKWNKRRKIPKLRKKKKKIHSISLKIKNKNKNSNKVKMAKQKKITNKRRVKN